MNVFYCKQCNALSVSNHENCAQCGQAQELVDYRKKSKAVIFALLLGGFGAHKFYLKQWWIGILYLLFCITLIPWIFAILEGIIYLFTSQHKWDQRYNHASASEQLNKKANRQLIMELIIVAGIIFLLALVALPVYKDMTARVRFQYALNEVTSKQMPIVESYFQEHQKLPESPTSLDASHKILFPDGGGTEIEANGKIKLWFDVIPRLKETSIYLIPHINNEELSNNKSNSANNKNQLIWHCDINGKEKERIENYLRSICQNIKPPLKS